MPTFVPATIAKETFDEIVRLIESAERYFSTDSAEVAYLFAKADRLQKVGAVDAFRARSLLYMACGDRESALGQVRKAAALGFDRKNFAAECMVLVNLGYFSDAQQQYSVTADPVGGHFNKYSLLGIACGALTQYESLVGVAEKMQLEQDHNMLNKVRNAIEILTEAGIDDKCLGAYFDVVGEIMREEHVFFVGSAPDFFVWNKDQENRFVHFSYRLPVDTARAESLDTEFVGRVLDRFGSIPEPLSITIKSGLSAHERRPERISSASQAAS